MKHDNKTIRTDHNDDQHSGIYIELDRPRRLHLGHGALRMFSALTHTPMSRLAEAMDDYDKMSCLYYCMLHADDPQGVTTENIDALLEPVPVVQLIELAAAAIGEAFGSDEDGSGADSAEDGEGNPTI